MTWARGQRTGSPTLKAVLMAVAEYADDRGVAWPSQARLAEDTELSERAVRNALSDLETGGFLSRETNRRQDGSRSADTIKLETNRHVTPVEQPARRSKQPARGAEPTGTSFQTNRHVVPNQPAPRAGLTTFEPPLNHQENRQRETRAERAPAQGSFISADWWPDDVAIQRAVSDLGSREAVDREIEKFRNHWLAKSGADGRKRDWSATFRNWIIRAQEYGNRTPNRTASFAPGAQSGRTGVDAVAASVARIAAARGLTGPRRGVDMEPRAGNPDCFDAEWSDASGDSGSLFGTGSGMPARARG